MDLYKDIILEHWRHPKNYHRIKAPTYSAKMQNSLCGDKIRLDIKTKGDRILDVGFSGDGCIISQATASLLTEEIIKMGTIKSLKEIDDKIVLKLIGVGIGIGRLDCALLSLKALKKAMIGGNYGR